MSAAQESFGSGIHRGRRAPADAVYDAVNALIDDEAQLFRRGGSTYLSGTDFAAPGQGIAAGLTAAGMRTLVWDGANVYEVADGGAVTSFGAGVVPYSQVRGDAASGFLVFPSTGTRRVVLYAGSRKAFYQTGTVSVTEGSRTVTGVGTAWTANIDKGMIFSLNAWSAPSGFSGRPAMSSSRGVIVESVNSNTVLTLRDPWLGGTAATQAYTLRPLSSVEVVPSDFPNRNVSAVAAVGSPPRLIACVENRAYYSPPGDVYGDPTDREYHELPASSWIIGATGMRDTAVLFTTAGVWTISNMSLDSVDAVGNIQHTVQQVNRDLLLWGDSAIVGWSGALVVPAVDDVFVWSQGAAPEPISAGIRPLYREYVDAGYRPGVASVFRGHYFLPITTGDYGTLVDVLVCRLASAAWTRWNGHAASLAYASRVGEATRSPKLFGLAGLRATDLTGCFDPDIARDDDADGADHQFTVETRDFDLVGTNRDAETATSAEAVYELSGAGTSVALSWSSGEEGSSYAALTAVRGGGVSDGSDFSAWRVGKRRRSIRLKLVQSGAAAKMILRRLALKTRATGR